MQKSTLFLSILLLIFCGSPVLAQGLDSLTQFNTERLHINKVGMITLGSWAVGNMAASAWALRTAEGTDKYFAQMNIYWNVVNLGLAGFGLHSALNNDPTTLNIFETYKAQASMEKVLLFNAGLDVGYILGGLYLSERSRRSLNRRQMLDGFGRSLILQGSFLLIFDLSMYFIHQRHFNQSKNMLENISFNLSPQHFGLVWQF